MWHADSNIKDKAGYTDTAAPIALKALMSCNLPESTRPHLL